MRLKALLCASLCSVPALAANEPVQVWLTTTSGSALVKRLNPESNQAFGPDMGSATAIDVTPALTYQTIDGFGGAPGDEHRGLRRGVAYHCYESPEGSYSVQSTFQNAYPNKEVHFTECTGGAWATNAAANLEWTLQNNLFGPLRHHARSSLY